MKVGMRIYIYNVYTRVRGNARGEILRTVTDCIRLYG